ncbi:STM4014 family protein [Parabacteroides sp. PF5-9]|uniref:STM4014 family protein n=1 Tax=Parabacteroides sp. PF5-9 TaxID=1742404 RepID=UPI002475002C|nr:STM4014 family protein [Parabacteroides sp. PF5-9]MDH6358515.1 glutathione synthase/RimK-type ligase-like ATP-grasp enzyme [Parabacteroides sp. PF5-9]
MQALVVSNEVSLRTTYFIKAGTDLGIDTRFITYDELENSLSGYDHVLIKLEPPVYQEAGFVIYHQLCRDYIRLLERIRLMHIADQVRFLNRPEAILSTLDKVKNKERLSGLPTTPLLSSAITCFDELICLLSSGGHSKVFIKPRYGSGAGGIMALRQHRKSGGLVAYTTLSLKEDYVFNTKRINRFTDLKTIALLTDTVFQQGALVEEWVVKDSFEGENYDLRVVVQFGQPKYVVVRCSKGVITNLHLNNRAESFDELLLPEELKEEIDRQSVRAVELSGLQYGGVDILIERDTMLPYIIEVNGQGDHIHRDIYHENNIYKEQLSLV